MALSDFAYDSFGADYETKTSLRPDAKERPTWRTFDFSTQRTGQSFVLRAGLPRLFSTIQVPHKVIVMMLPPMLGSDNAVVVVS